MCLPSLMCVCVSVQLGLEDPDGVMFDAVDAARAAVEGGAEAVYFEDAAGAEAFGGEYDPPEYDA